jgi:hypothetical protein
MTRLLWCVAQFFLILLSATATLGASDSDFGFLWISSVRAAAHQGEAQKLVGSVVIGVYLSTEKSHSESFTIADQTGYAMIPLRPGNYCAEAYGTNGRKLRLDENTNGGQPICFDIAAHKVAEAGVTISHDVDYKPDIPSKGVD